MSVDKHSSLCPDLRKEEVYNLEEMVYHQEQLLKSLREASYHLLKSREHMNRLKDLSIPKWEGSDVLARS